MNDASQTCQYDSGLVEVLNTKDKKNEKCNSTQDLYSCEKDGNVLKENYIASQIGVRLEGKNVINLSRRNLSASEISLLSKGLKFVPTANKIDCEKQNQKKLKGNYNYKEIQTLEMTSDHLQLIHLDLSLPLIKGIRTSSQRHILAAQKKDYQTLRFLSKDLTMEAPEALYSLKDNPSYKKQRNFCVNLLRKTKKELF